MSLRHWLGALPHLPSPALGRRLGALPHLPSPAWQTQAVQPILYSGLTKTISLQYLRPDISGRTTIPFEWPWPRFIHHSSSGTILGNCSWEHFEEFLGTMPKNSWEQIFISVAPNYGKEEFPEIPGNKFYWRGQEQTAQVPGNREHLSTSAMTWQRQFWGPNRTSKSFSGVWDFWLCLFDDVLCCQRGGRQLQPQSNDLHNSCENHPAIMQVQQADLNVCTGNHFLWVPAQPQELLRRKLRNRQDKDGVLKFLFFHRSWKFPDLFGFSVDISLLKMGR